MTQERSFLKSLNAAVEGFIHVVRHERNMRVHFLFAFLVLILAIFLGVSRLEWIILCVTVTFVLITEMLNTAIEDTLDLVKDSFHPAVRVIKDVSAGIVLVSAMNALIVGFFIFSRYWMHPFGYFMRRIRYASWHITFVSLLVTIFCIIAGKVFWRRGTPLRGGILSGHSAVAFSLWTAVLFTQSNPFVSAAALVLAALVAHGRVRAKIHSLLEVLAGALVGTLVTALFFKMFR